MIGSQHPSNELRPRALWLASPWHPWPLHHLTLDLLPRWPKRRAERPLLPHPWTAPNFETLLGWPDLAPTSPPRPARAKGELPNGLSQQLNNPKRVLFDKVKSLDVMADSSGLDDIRWQQRYDLEADLVPIHHQRRFSGNKGAASIGSSRATLTRLTSTDFPTVVNVAATLIC